MAAAFAQLALMFGLLAAAVVVAGVGATFPRLASWRTRRRAAREPLTSRRPLQVVASELRRLTRQLALVPSGAPMVRRQALLAAYESVLMEAAAQLEVPHQLAGAPRGPFRTAERQRLLAALEEAGLAVRA